MDRLKPMVVLATLLVAASCTKQRQTIIPPGSDVSQCTEFTLRQEDGKWRLYREDEEFFVKGAAANRYYKRVSEFGGNAFRTYSTTLESTPSILNEAYRNGLYVNMGLAIGRERDGFDYNNAEKVEAQKENIRALVRKFRNHPSVMCWSIGNEAESMYTNLNLWTAVNDIAAMIHEEDPCHPVTTALASSNVTTVSKIVEMAPELDFLCINSYYPNPMNITGNLAAAGWTKPWMLTEFGQMGTWMNVPKTSFGTLVEETSTQKAESYRIIYSDAVLANRDNGCLGSFAFVWGYQNHGDVLTWYGLFDKEGNAYAAVDELYNSWNGHYPEKRAPEIKDRNALKMNGKTADESIAVSPGSENVAEVTATSPCGARLYYKWVVYLEGTAASDGSYPDGIGGLFTDDSSESVSFTAPSAVGNYRLCVFVTDSNKKAALAVIPFRVE
ncbi:MAG: glycoside hydrolase family 2 TIM barrel-domain containing protein [Candidatus Cryptobacteroides sp.]